MLGKICAKVGFFWREALWVAGGLWVHCVLWVAFGLLTHFVLWVAFGLIMRCALGMQGHS